MEMYSWEAMSASVRPWATSVTSPVSRALSLAVPGAAGAEGGVLSAAGRTRPRWPGSLPRRAARPRGPGPGRGPAGLTQALLPGAARTGPRPRTRARLARNLALAPGERFEDIRFLLRDRGSNFTSSFDAVFQATGTRILRTAVQTPRMNATCERLVGTLRRALLDRAVLILSEQRLRAILTEYQAHYNTARPHQGIAQRAPDDEVDAARTAVTDVDSRRIRRKAVLGGLINEYAYAA